MAKLIPDTLVVVLEFLDAHNAFSKTCARWREVSTQMCLTECGLVRLTAPYLFRALQGKPLIAVNKNRAHIKKWGESNDLPSLSELIELASTTPIEVMLLRDPHSPLPGLVLRTLAASGARIICAHIDSASPAAPEEGHHPIAEATTLTDLKLSFSLSFQQCTNSPWDS